MIGSIVSLREPRHVCLAERRADRENVRRRVRNKMVAFIRIGGTFLRNSTSKREYDYKMPDRTPGPEKKPSISESTQPQPKGRSCGNVINRKLLLVATKWRGANNEPPPPFSNIEALWTFCGCFLTLWMLLTFSDAITKQNPDLSLVTGPFGVSLLALLDA